MVRSDQARGIVGTRLKKAQKLREPLKPYKTRSASSTLPRR